MNTPINEQAQSGNPKDQPKRSKLKRNLLLMGIGILIGVAGWWIIIRPNQQEEIDRISAIALTHTTQLCSDVLSTVFGTEGLVIVDDRQLGMSVYEPQSETLISLENNVDSDDFEYPIALNARAVVLVHGLDEPGGIWDQLIPALSNEGYQVLVFEYLNDQSIAQSASQLTQSLEMIEDLGVSRVDFVCHSMGGLVTRDAFTRDGFDQIGLEVGDYITLGTPHYGSPWARLQAISEMREQVQRWAQSDDFKPGRLLGFAQDGVGEAGKDLLPGSDFLNELNARTIKDEIQITCVVGRTIPEHKDKIGALIADGILNELVGVQDAQAIDGGLRKLIGELGDGVVPVSSAQLEGADHLFVIEANHRSIIRNVEFEEMVRSMSPLPQLDEPLGIDLVLQALKND